MRTYLIAQETLFNGGDLNGKEIQKRGCMQRCVYVEMIHFAVQLKLTKLYSNLKKKEKESTDLKITQQNNMPSSNDWI